MTHQHLLLKAIKKGCKIDLPVFGFFKSLQGSITINEYTLITINEYKLIYESEYELN